MSARYSRMSAPIDPEAALLVSVLCHSLTAAETDAWRLRHKNAKMLRLAIELSKREANKETKAAQHAIRCRAKGAAPAPPT